MQLDSLQAGYNTKSAELDEIFATINEVEQGLNSIRESENIIAFQAKDGLNIPGESREEMKADMQAIREAIEKYRRQIDELQKNKKYQSVQFQKRLKDLQKELSEKSGMIESLSRQLEEKNAQLIVKTQQIASLDQVVSELKNDISDLRQEGDRMKKKMADQEAELYSSYYIVGNKQELIEAGVMTKGGLFKSAKVSYQAEKNSFIRIDYREITIINTNAAKAKILSVHPKGTYALEQINGEAVLTISDPEAFWEPSRYLVIQAQ